MKKMKIFILLIVSLVWVTPDAFAFLKDDGQDSGESNMIQEMMHKKTYHDMVEERKRKSKKSMQERKKRTATLTPFVTGVSYNSTGLSQQGKNTEKKDTPQKPSLPTQNTDMRKEVSQSIFANFLIIAACFVGIIFMSKYLRPKK